MNNLFPGDEICENEGFIRGHGTHLDNGKIISAYFGKASQINKLMTVNPNYSYKYSPEIGDIVIGRVLEIYNKKWKIDTNCKSETTLNLSAINLPGVVQRRKIESDEMEMRKIFNIGDILVCEVQKVSKSGSGALHTRSDKYGKLTGGFLIKIPTNYLVFPKTRFITKNTTSVIVASNGHIWVSDLTNFVMTSKINVAVMELLKNCQKIDIEKILEEIYL